MHFSLNSEHLRRIWSVGDTSELEAESPAMSPIDPGIREGKKDQSLGLMKLPVYRTTDAKS